MTQTFCVLLTRPDLPSVMDIAKPFAQFHGRLVPDVLALLKTRSGLLEDGLNESDANRLSGLLTAAGLSNAVIPSDELPPRLPAHQITSIQVLEKGLAVSVQAGSWQIIPWSAFCLFAVAVLKEITIHTTATEQGPSAQEKLIKAGILLTTGLPLPLSKRKTVSSRSEETNLHYYADLFLEKPEMRLRLDGNKLDYQFLGETMTFGAQENFRSLLRELNRRRPDAQPNAAFVRMVSTPPQALVYQESEKLFDEECRWLLTLRRALRR